VQRIGVDAVSVDRVALAVSRSGPKFLNKVYTAAEQAYCAGNAERLAGRWAAKEAVIKCFDGTGICFPRRRIEVLPAPNGAPKVRLLGEHRGARVEVSITHHSRLAVATAHLEMPDVGDSLLPAPDAVLLPERPRDAHKGTFGTAIVLAGRTICECAPLSANNARILAVTAAFRSARSSPASNSDRTSAARSASAATAAGSFPSSSAASSARASAARPSSSS